MKTPAILWLGLSGLVINNLAAEDLPAGRLFEVHSCELYAGGCLVSSQATLEGRYLLRVWDINRGTYAGADLSGLQAAALEVAQDNLAQKQTRSVEAVIYLPETATANQREALMAWLKSVEPEFKQLPLHTRIVPLNVAKTPAGERVSAGEFIRVVIRPLAPCDTGSCGEQLWYIPRSPASVFTVGVSQACRIQEPQLHLKWSDGGQRSVFVARFGGPVPAKSIYLSATDFCGPSLRLD